MKTRIISGIVMGAIVAAVLTVGFLWESVVITIAIAIIAAVAIYELLHNAAGIKDKLAISGACVFTALYVIGADNKLIDRVFSLTPYAMCSFTGYIQNFYNYWSYAVTGIMVLYFIFAVIMILKNHKEFGLGQIVSLFALPFPYAYFFSCLNGVIGHTDGIYYLLLLLNFSSVCDMGAYFTGVTCGKHKLCPNISPKKTVEGAIGGVVSSIIFTLIITLCFGKSIVLPLILTIPLCILGMIGDLFASAIKRSVNLKDYGSLIPGHGGILDRVDSIIMIVPLMNWMITIGIL